MAQKPETLFRANRVLPFLRLLRNATAFPIQQLSIKGTPDFLVCVRGRFVALELKSGTEKPAKLQTYFLGCVRESGGIPIVARPSNWEGVKAFLTRLDQGDLDGKDEVFPNFE